jgi:hypothetical protein
LLALVQDRSVLVINCEILQTFKRLDRSVMYMCYSRNDTSMSSGTFRFTRALVSYIRIETSTVQQQAPQSSSQAHTVVFPKGGQVTRNASFLRYQPRSKNTRFLWSSAQSIANLFDLEASRATVIWPFFGNTTVYMRVISQRNTGFSQANQIEYLTRSGSAGPPCYD